RLSPPLARQQIIPSALFRFFPSPSLVDSKKVRAGRAGRVYRIPGEGASKENAARERPHDNLATSLLRPWLADGAVKPMPNVFISYRREDSTDITYRLDDWLSRHFGRDNVFLDIDTIPPGVDFHKHLDAAVGRCDVLLAVIGSLWLEVRHREGKK